MSRISGMQRRSNPPAVRILPMAAKYEEGFRIPGTKPPYRIRNCKMISLSLSSEESISNINISGLQP